jgi:hypothetical protein
MIGDQRNFEQVRRPFAVRSLGRQIQNPILDQFDNRSEVGEERVHRRAGGWA